MRSPRRARHAHRIGVARTTPSSRPITRFLTVRLHVHGPRRARWAAIEWPQTCGVDLPERGISKGKGLWWLLDLDRPAASCRCSAQRARCSRSQQGKAATKPDIITPRRRLLGDARTRSTRVSLVCLSVCLSLERWKVGDLSSMDGARHAECIVRSTAQNARQGVVTGSARRLCSCTPDQSTHSSVGVEERFVCHLSDACHRVEC